MSEKPARSFGGVRKQSSGRGSGRPRQLVSGVLARPPHAVCRKLNPTCKRKKFPACVGASRPRSEPSSTTLAAKEEFACFCMAARVSEALRWSLEMSEGTGYGLTAWIDPQEMKDTRGVRAAAPVQAANQRAGQTLFGTKIMFSCVVYPPSNGWTCMHAHGTSASPRRERVTALRPAAPR